MAARNSKNKKTKKRKMKKLPSAIDTKLKRRVFLPACAVLNFFPPLVYNRCGFELRTVSGAFCLSIQPLPKGGKLLCFWM